jgi:hypothetical protein
VVTFGEITQLERSIWQRRAAAELAAILRTHGDLPPLTWTVASAGSTLLGRVATPASAPRAPAVFDAWKTALVLEECPCARAAGTLHRGRGGVMVRREQCASQSDASRAQSIPVRPAGLLEKLLAAIRPEFRQDDLAFDPRHPVFGGPACAVDGCERPARSNCMCWGHRVRWEFAGKPDTAAFLAATSADWVGHRPVAACGIDGCHFGMHSRGMCLGQLNTFLRTIRVHRWDETLPGNAVFVPEDYPTPPPLLPRAVAEYVMAQLEDPGNLDLWRDPARRLITLILILIRCGLRISDALNLSFDPISQDADGAPYLRYFNGMRYGRDLRERHVDLRVTRTIVTRQPSCPLLPGPASRRGCSGS